MFRYQTCGSIIESDCALPELIPYQGEKRSSFSFRLNTSKQYAKGQTKGFTNRLDDNQKLWVSIGRSRYGYTLRFPDLANFDLAASSGVISCHAPPGIPSETIRHLFLDLVIPFALSAQGKVVMHGSAVSSSQGAIVFLGRSGAGKSTLAAGFASQGHALLSDDLLVPRDTNHGFVITPSYPSIRLWDDVAGSFLGLGEAISPVAHYTSKKRLHFSENRRWFARKPLPLSKVYVLAPPNRKSTSITIHALPGREACMEVIKNTFVLDHEDRNHLSEIFQMASKLGCSTPFFRIAYPRETRFLPAVREAILGSA